MKTTITLLFSVLASVSAKTFRGWRGFHETKLQNVFSTGNTTEFVIHGLLGETHCEEVYIPSLEYKEFISDPHEAPYKKYHKGLCPVPFTTIDSVSRDGDFPEVTHLKRGVRASGGGASLAVSSCGGSASGLKFSYSSSPKKGSPTTITASGTIPSGSSGGSFTINAAIGGTSLVNNVKTDNCKQFSKSIFLVGKIEASTCPSGGKDSMSVTIPVPNISGQVTAKLESKDSSGNVLICADLVMDL